MHVCIQSASTPGFWFLHTNLWPFGVNSYLLPGFLQQHDAIAWFVNTGWTAAGCVYGFGERISLKNTQAIVDAIHNGDLDDTNYNRMPVLNLDVPLSVSGVPDHLLQPWTAWSDPAGYSSTLLHLEELS